MKYQTIPVTSYQQNCSLIWCEDTNQAALIDPGGEADRILEIVKNQDLKLVSILLTHGHIDHVGGSREIADILDIPIIGPQKEEAFWLDNLPYQAEMFDFTHADPLVPNQWLEEGDEVKVGNICFSVLHCPGHTPGHIIFYDSVSKTAFVGDVLFKGSIGRTDFPQGDHATLINAIKTKLLPLGDDVTFIPGHGPISTLGQERLTNPFIQ